MSFQSTAVNEHSKDPLALDTHTQAEQLLDLTQAMLTAAKADAWDAFGLLEPQLVGRFRDSKPPPLSKLGWIAYWRMNSPLQMFNLFLARS